MNILLKYIKNILIAADQFVNAVTGGDPDETISSRTGKIYTAWNGRDRKWTVAYWIHLVLNKLQKNHCERAIEEDEGKNKIL